MFTSESETQIILFANFIFDCIYDIHQMKKIYFSNT